MLERIVARRLGDIVLKFRLVSLFYFGAIPSRSAGDLAATLTHDIEKVWERKEVLTRLAFDIKGTFNRVVEEKLTDRLWEQGIPLTLSDG